MSGWCKASAHGRDEGVAIVVAVAVTMLAGILVLMVTAIARFQSSATGHDRQRSSAVATAEGMVDSLVAEINGSDTSLLPFVCGQITNANRVVGRDSMDSVATVTYYAADSTTAIPCGALGVTPPAFAAVGVTTTAEPIGDGLPAQRTLETFVRLSPAYANVLNKALFSESGITIGNNSDILASNAGEGNDAGVYTNGPLTNAGGSNQVIQGDLLSQASITWTKTLFVEGNVWARNNVTLGHNSITVGQNVLASTGSAVLNPGVTVGKDVRAGSSITWSGCTTESCFAPDAVPPPPVLALPVITWSHMSEYRPTGSSTVLFGAGGLPCSADAVGFWIRDHASTLTEPTVVESRCAEPVRLSGVNTVLANDLAVFSATGFTLKSTTLAGDSSTPATAPRRLYLVQPKDAVLGSCPAAPTVTTNSGIDFVTRVATLLYTPCSVDLGQYTKLNGQVYAGGTINIAQHSRITYSPLEALGVAAPSAVSSYSVELLYKRESMNG